MSWQFVFNSDGFTGGTRIEEVAEAAMANFYKFFCFNGLVYFVDPKCRAFETGITRKDLF